MNNAVTHASSREVIDRDATSARTVLRQLVLYDSGASVNEETVVRVRGMFLDASRQFLAGQGSPADLADADVSAIAARLAGDDGWLVHVHALALEGTKLEWLRVTRGLDPVAAPAIAAMVAGEDSESARLAHTVVAAQARFVQQHRRMELTLRDVPGDLLEVAMALLPANTAPDGANPGDSATRPALLARVASLSGDAGLLEVSHAGLSLFASTLAAKAGVRRDAVMAILAGNCPDDAAPFLRDAGLSPDATARQIAWLFDRDLSSTALGTL